jgi:uncharacterized caspase-like protein
MNSRARDYLFEREPGRHALVIGNAEYEHLAPLESAKLDAEQMAGALKRLGFTVTLALRLPSVRAFEDSILPAFRKNIQRGDVVVFYFSGHGFAYGPDNYIAPADLPLVVSAELVGDHAIAVESIEDYFARRSPALVLMLIDACRAIGGFVIRGSDNRNAVASGVVERARASENMNIVEAYAARAGSVALGSSADGALSPFTRSLAARIEMKDAEFTAMFRDVAADVAGATRQSQRPGIVNWSATDLYLNPTAKTRARENAAWLAALGSGAWDEVQRFTYRHALSRHAAAARQWLETHSQNREAVSG